MSVLFIVLIGGSIILLIVGGSPNMVVTVMLEGAMAAITLAVKLCSIYAVWLSVMRMVSALKLDRMMTQLFSPVVRRLFRGEDADTLNVISMNLATNMLGLGGVATPLGIDAMHKMSGGGERMTDNMMMFLVINCTGLQIIPATVIALRAAAGSHEPSDIFLPSVLATAATTALGMLMVYARRFICRRA